MAAKEWFEEELDWQKYWLVIKRHWVPAALVFAGVLASAATYTFLQEPLYKSKGELLITSSLPTARLTGLGPEVQGETSTSALSAIPDTQVEVILSVGILQAVADSLNEKQLQSEPFTYGTLIDNLNVEVVAPTNAIEVSYKAPDPAIAAAVVDTVMDTYISKGAEARREEAIKAREFMQEQLPRTEVAVRQAQEALRRFSEENGFSELPEEKGSAVQILATLDQQISDARAQLANSESQAAELRNQLGMSSQQALTATALRQSPGVQSVLTQLQDVESALALDKTRFRSDSPPVIEKQNRVNALRGLLQERIGEVLGSTPSEIDLSGPIQGVGSLESDVVGNFITVEGERLGEANQLATLEKTREEFKQRLDRFSKLEPQFQELRRKVTAAQATYQGLLDNLQQAQAIENQNIGNARVISPALASQTPSDPKVLLLLGAGSFVGIMLGVATAYTLDIADRSVKTVQEAEDLFGYPILGTIPDYRQLGIEGKKANGKDRANGIELVITRDLPRSSTSEAYRLLKGNLTYFGADDRKQRTLLLTSSVSGEGKSEVSANLAATMSRLGHRVLLVEADMRRPTQHQKWGLSHSAGLSNVLAGQTPLMVATHEVLPNLDVLLAGDIPSDPMQLLESRAMVSLLRSFSKSYDFTIIDAPPLMGTVDASILSELADGTILVVRPGVVDYNAATYTRKHLAQGEFKVIGMVLNAVNVRNEPYNYYRYYTKEEVSRSLQEQQARL